MCACRTWQLDFWKNLAGNGAMRRSIRFPADNMMANGELRMFCVFLWEFTCGE